MRKFLLAIILLSFLDLALAKEVPFTQEDRDKLRSIEIKVERLEVKVEEGQRSLQKQIDDLRTKDYTTRTAGGKAPKQGRHTQKGKEGK